MAMARAPEVFRLRLLDEQPLLSSSGKDVVKVSCDDGYIYIHRCLLLSDSKMFRDRSAHSESSCIILDDVKVLIADQVLRLLYQGFTLIRQEDYEEIKNLIKYFGMRDPESTNVDPDDDEVFESNAELTCYTFNEKGETFSLTNSIDAAQVNSIMILEYDDIMKENYKTAIKLNEVYVPVLKPVVNKMPTKVTTITVTYSSVEDTPTQQFQQGPSTKEASAQPAFATNISNMTLSTALEPTPRESGTSSDAVNQPEDNKPLAETIPEFIKDGPEHKLSKVTRVESGQRSSTQPDNDVLDKMGSAAAGVTPANAGISEEPQTAGIAGVCEKLKKLPEARKVAPPSFPTHAPKKATPKSRKPAPFTKPGPLCSKRRVVTRRSVASAKANAALSG